MKKLFLTLGIACLFMVACNNTPKQEVVEEQAPETEAIEEEHSCPMCPIKAEFANWDQMDEAAQAELVAKAKATFDEMDAKMAEEAPACCNHEGEEGHECNHEGEEGHQCNHEGEEGHVCEHEGEEGHVCMHQMMAKWAEFDTLTLEEQKDLIMARFEAMKAMGCCKHAEEAAEEVIETVEEVVAE